jgi:hypothetical protein
LLFDGVAGRGRESLKMLEERVVKLRQSNPESGNQSAAGEIEAGVNLDATSDIGADDFGGQSRESLEENQGLLRLT